MSKMNIVLMGLAIGNLVSIIDNVVEIKKVKKNKAEATSRLEVEHGVLVGLVISNIKSEVENQLHDSIDGTEEVVQECYKDLTGNLKAVLTETDIRTIKEEVCAEFEMEIF